MQGYWQDGKYILASTQERKIEGLRSALKKIVESAASNGEDVSYLLAKNALCVCVDLRETIDGMECQKRSDD